MPIRQKNGNTSPSNQGSRTYKKLTSDHSNQVELYQAEGPPTGRNPSPAFALRAVDTRKVIAKYQANPVHIDKKGNPDTYAKTTYVIVEVNSKEEVGRHPSMRGLSGKLFELAFEHAQRLVADGQATGIWDRTYRSNKLKTN